MFSEEPDILGSVMSHTVVVFKFFEESSITMAEQISQMPNKNLAPITTVSVQSEAREGHRTSWRVGFRPIGPSPETVNKTGIKAVQEGGRFKPQLWREGWGDEDSTHLESTHLESTAKSFSCLPMDAATVIHSYQPLGSEVWVFLWERSWIVTRVAFSGFSGLREIFKVPLLTTWGKRETNTAKEFGKSPS